MRKLSVLYSSLPVIERIILMMLVMRSITFLDFQGMSFKISRRKVRDFGNEYEGSIINGHLLDPLFLYLYHILNNKVICGYSFRGHT